MLRRMVEVELEELEERDPREGSLRLGERSERYEERGSPRREVGERGERAPPASSGRRLVLGRDILGGSVSPSKELPFPSEYIEEDDVAAPVDREPIELRLFRMREGEGGVATEEEREVEEEDLVRGLDERVRC